MLTRTTFYWRGRPNFGDELGPLLLRHFAHVRTRWTEADKADIVTVGSILHLLPHDYTGIVAGCGKLKESVTIRLPKADVLGIRGPLTARDFRGDYALGDPGLLADELVPHPVKVHNLGVVPHWSDTTLPERFAKWDPLVIRPNQNPLEVVRAIGSCKKLVASSLHGIILADAFGIPRRIEMTPRFANEGGDFKFRDHNAAVGVRHEIGVTQEAPRHLVQDRQHEIFDVFEALGNMFRDKP
jgi:pyruvyltransferase